jgi:hypothetical protein
VLGNRTERHVEPSGDLAGGQLLAPDQAEDLAAARFRDDLQGIHASPF